MTDVCEDVYGVVKVVVEGSATGKMEREVRGVSGEWLDLTTELTT